MNAQVKQKKSNEKVFNLFSFAETAQVENWAKSLLGVFVCNSTCLSIPALMFAWRCQQEIAQSIKRFSNARCTTSSSWLFKNEMERHVKAINPRKLSNWKTSMRGRIEFHFFFRIARVIKLKDHEANIKKSIGAIFQPFKPRMRLWISISLDSCPPDT